MGEEVKKTEEKKTEEPKKIEEEKKEQPKSETTEKQPLPPPPADEKKEEKKTEAAPPPPPPQEIVLKVYMHCEGCARKVRRCLKGFEGVEEVITDCRTSKVVVKGEKADPLKVLEKVQKKSHRQVELISPVPKPPVEEPKKPEVAKTEEKKEEPPAITVVLGVYMHCEACAQEIKKRIQRMKGVESAEPDLKNSQVTVKGVFEPKKLTDYVYKRCGKHAVIIKAEPEKKEEEKGKEEKKAEEGGEKEAKKAEDGGKENKEGGGGGGEGEGEGGEPTAKVEVVEAEDSKLELKKNEFYQYYPQNNFQVYPQRFVQDMYAYPPQIFSDENPNACSVM